MKKFLLAITMFMCISGSAVAGPVSQDIWYTFGFGDARGDAVSGAGFGQGKNPTVGTTSGIADQPAWTITLTQGATLTVLDLFLSVNQFEIFNFGTSIGLTSSPMTGGTAGSDITAALADARYSRGVFDLDAGSYSFTISNITGSGGAGVFAIEPVGTVPEPASLALVALALSVAAAVRRRA